MMLKNISLYAILVLKYLVTCDDYTDKTYTNCVMLKDSNSCLEYKLIKFIKKIEMDSITTKTSGVIGKMNETERTSPEEEATIMKMFELLKGVLHPADKTKRESSKIVIATKQRSIQETPKKNLIESK